MFTHPSCDSSHLGGESQRGGAPPSLAVHVQYNSRIIRMNKETKNPPLFQFVTHIHHHTDHSYRQGIYPEVQ